MFEQTQNPFLVAPPLSVRSYMTLDEDHEEEGFPVIGWILIALAIVGALYWFFQTSRNAPYEI